MLSSSILLPSFFTLTAKHFLGPMDSGITACIFEWLVVNDKTLLVETLSTPHLDILEGQSKIFCKK